MQIDLPFTIVLPVLKRNITTFKKLPIIVPSKKIKIKINTFMYIVYHSNKQKTTQIGVVFCEKLTETYKQPVAPAPSAVAFALEVPTLSTQYIKSVAGPETKGASTAQASAIE